MSLRISFPFEILEQIIDEVALQQNHRTNGKHDGLRACSLVCKAFAERSRKHLFSSIFIYTYDSQCDRLHSALVSSPEIASYVREFGFQSRRRTAGSIEELEKMERDMGKDQLVIDHPLLPAIMAALKNVAIFSLICIPSYCWEFLSPALTEEIQTMCSSPSMTRIFLSGLDYPPLTLLHGISCIDVSLEVIALIQVGPYSDFQIHPPKERIGLRSLCLNCVHVRPSLDFVRAFQPPHCRLERITVDTESEAHLAIQLAYAHKDTLKALIINSNFYEGLWSSYCTCFANMSFIVPEITHFFQLEEIALSNAVHTSDMSDDDLLDLNNLKFLSNLARTENKIETIRIQLHIWVHSTNNICFLDNPPQSKELWEDLTNSGFPCLRNFNIKLGGRLTHGEYEVLKKRLCDLFAGMSDQHGVLTVDNVVGVTLY